MADFDWDIFISHASEDKEGFVRPIAQLLDGIGVRVWYDEFTLEVGDSLSRSIDKGLSRSRYGAVVISRAFLRKQWPELELRGLVARAVATEKKVILPIWYGVTRNDVLAYSPPLADLRALDGTRLSVNASAFRDLKATRRLSNDEQRGLFSALLGLSMGLDADSILSRNPSVTAELLLAAAEAVRDVIPDSVSDVTTRRPDTAQ